MKYLTSFLHSFFVTLEKTRYSLALWAITFFALIVFRLVIDLSLERFPALTFTQFFFQWAHLFLFFLFSYLILLPLIMNLGKSKLEEAASVLLFGFLIILFPPIIDKIIFGDSFYWSFYIFDSLANMPSRFFTFFGEKPHLGITYGVRAEVALVLMGSFLYGLIKTGKLLRTTLITFATYTALFILGTLPSWLTYIILGPSKNLLEIRDTHIAELFLSPEVILGREVLDLRSALSYKMSLLLFLLIFGCVFLLWYWVKRKECLAFLKNVRWPQVFYHNGLLLLGMLLALFYTEVSIPSNFFSLVALLVLMLAVTFSWLASVLWNDLFDQKIDTHTNAFRPLITGVLTASQYHTYALTLFFFSIFGALLVSFQAALILVAYQALAILYSLPPFRLKRFLGIATLIAGFAGILVLFVGYTTLTPGHTLVGLPVNITLYLLIIYTVMIPLKDFKDVSGDKADKVYTLPVVLGIPRAKIVMSVVVFLVFTSSIFVLHAPALLLWALLFGSIGFWVIQKAGTPKSSISYQRLSLVFMCLAFFYGLSLVIFLF